MQPFYGLSNNIKLLSGALAVLALALFIPFATNLVQQRVSTTPQANIEAPISKTSVLLQQHQFNCAVGDPVNGIPPSASCNQLNVNKLFAVDVLVHSDIDAANLVNVQLAYSPAELAVEKIVFQNGGVKETKTNTNPKIAKDFFIDYWVAREYNNQTGTIKLTGAVPTPGFITTPGNKPVTMARIYFRPKQTGNFTISMENSTAIYRNADNLNILNSAQPLTISINNP